MMTLEAKEYLALAAVAIFIIAVCLGIALFARQLSAAATPVTIVKPAEGIICALANGTDSVSIDCWKEIDR